MNKYRPITLNRRAKYDYDIKDRLLAGLVLLGTEVKSVRAGKAELKGAFATLKDNELWLNNASIPPFQASQPASSYQPERTRKLLVHRSELRKLNQNQQSGLSIIPLSLGLQGGYVKAELGLGRGKKVQDKRQTIKKRMAERETRRRVKRGA